MVVTVSYDTNFEKCVRSIKDGLLKTKIKKQIRKIIENPEKGRFLKHEKGVRKIYIKPFRLLYIYKNKKLYLLDFNHRDEIYKKRKKRRN